MFSKFKLFLIFFICIIALPVFAQDSTKDVALMKAEIEKNTTLTLEQCLDTALKNNPEILESLYKTQAYKSKIGQAQSSYFPQVNLSSGIDRSNPSTNNSNSDISRKSLSGNISLNQLIYDFGRTSNNIKIKKLDYQASVESLYNQINDIVFSLKQAFYEVLLNRQKVVVYKETIEQYEQQLQQVNGYYEKGYKSKIDVTTAQANLSSAKLGLIKAENLLKTSVARLDKAMGLDKAPTYSIEGELEYTDLALELDEAFELAIKNNPTIKEAILFKNSAEKNIKLSRSEYFPELSGVSSIGMAGEDDLDSRWTIGANISLPVFNGLLTNKKIQEAKANFEAQKQNLENKEQQLLLDIKIKYFAFQEAKESIPVAEIFMKQTQERFELAKKRYKVGIGDPIELKDSEMEYREAKLSYLESLYDYNVAIFNLEKSIGNKIPDMEDKL